MATMPALTSEAIALTEKKMDMTLDDIIKMSKKYSSKAKKPRASNKSGRFPNGSASRGISSKVQRFMDSRSSLRQGLLAQRRSNFRGNQFPLAAEAARKAAVAPIRNVPLSRNRVTNWNKQRAAALRNTPANSFVGRVKMLPKQRPQTLDSLFANMKEQRMRQHQQTGRGRKVGHQRSRRGRGRGRAAANGARNVAQRSFLVGWV